MGISLVYLNDLVRQLAEHIHSLSCSLLRNLHVCLSWYNNIPALRSYYKSSDTLWAAAEPALLGARPLDKTH